MIPLAAPHQRAGVLSVVYVISYLAMGLPAVIAGFLLVHEGDLLATAVQYGVAVMALAALALGGAARTARQAAQADPVAASRPAGPADLGGLVPVPVPAPARRRAARLVAADRPSRTARRSVRAGTGRPGLLGVPLRCRTGPRHGSCPRTGLARAAGVPLRAEDCSPDCVPLHTPVRNGRGRCSRIVGRAAATEVAASAPGFSPVVKAAGREPVRRDAPAARCTAAGQR